MGYVVRLVALEVLAIIDSSSENPLHSSAEYVLICWSSFSAADTFLVSGTFHINSLDHTKC